MSAEEKNQILKVLSGAIIRETNAFNYYYRGSEDERLPSGARGLLSRLAEEERVHRQLLVEEYKAIEKGWNGIPGEEGEATLSYSIPEKLTWSPLATAAGLEAAALTLPSRLVGGDNLVSRVLKGPGGREMGTLMLLYDAMGHSMKTTELNAIAARAVGEYIDSTFTAGTEKDILSPASIVGLINDRIAARYEGEGVFLTVLCVFIDPAGERLVYSSAGHEPPFIVEAGGGSRSLLQTQLIAGIDSSFKYREQGVPFRSGEVFCVFSDGVIEAQNDSGRIFGREGVARLLEKNTNEPPGVIIERLLGGLDAHLGGRPLEDEVTVMVVKRKGDH